MIASGIKAVEKTWVTYLPAISHLYRSDSCKDPQNSMDQECVSLSFDRTELESSEQRLTRTFSTDLTPSPEVIAALTLIQRSVQDYSYNKNHPIVSPSLLLSLEPTIQQRINLLNTCMNSKVRDCSDQKSYDEMWRLAYVS